MANSIQSVALDKLVPHPDNPNRMSRANFGKLVRNIERTGRYEPLIVRPAPKKKGYFQIINGEHRCRALVELGYNSADAIIWDVDDEQADILLATLNRLGGSDELAKKLKLLKHLNERFGSGELSKLLPQTAKQLERLTNLKMPGAPVKIEAKSFLTPVVFFLNDAQQKMLEKALALIEEPKVKMTAAAKRAAALAHMAGHFYNHLRLSSGVFDNGQKKAIE